MTDLAVIIRKEHGTAAIESLQSAGIYDRTRRIREHDDESLEIPVTREPTNGSFTTVIHQSDPDSRMTVLADYLIPRGWSDAEIEHAPNSWSVIGDVILVRLPAECPRPGEVGDALLELHRNAETVVTRNGISGDHREPAVEVLAGTGDTETVHVEGGTKYKLDLSTVMFSPGNKAERIRMGEVTNQGERVLDMFAGIGYFSLPIARAGGRVTAIERNPTAFRFLVENGEFNGVQNRIRPIRGDCRDVVSVLAASENSLAVDRVVMGYYDAVKYLESAFLLIDSEGLVHLHSVVPEPELWADPIDHLESVATESECSLSIVDRRRIKTHSPGMVHVVIDAHVARNP